MISNEDNENALLIYRKAAEALVAPTPIVVILGTHQFLKFPIGMHALLTIAAQHPGNYLIRLLELGLAKRGMHKDKEVEELMKFLARKRQVRTGNSTIFLDSILESSQKNTPGEISGALFYASEGMTKQSGQMQALTESLPEYGKVILATWTDNQDMSWMHGLGASFIQVHTNDLEYRKRMLELKGHMSDEDYGRLSGL